MISATANRMLSRSMRNLRYDYAAIDWKPIITTNLGLYVHVPFCERLCAFCPFHRVLYDKDKKDAYLKALLREIELRELEGDVEWVYFGGGTPNLLKAEEIGQILNRFKEFVSCEDIGMEGKPPFFTREYLESVAKHEISKISMGVETLKPETLRRVERDRTDLHLIRQIVNDAHDLGMVVNADLMVGLPLQYRADFLLDITKIAETGIDQITTYPYTKAPGAKMHKDITSKDIFDMIESADDILTDNGFVRENVWVFSTPELAKKAPGEHPEDYQGFGPSAFSKVEKLQIVNPHLDDYLKHISGGHCFGFKILFEDNFDYWRKFAHKLYDLHVGKEFLKTMPFSIRTVANLLKLSGYLSGEDVTRRGRYFVHDLTINAIESLPYPLGNPVSRGVACMNIFF
ncbi:MAG: radical SAM protein [Candidatus Thorarchaeota archaeon]